jgi:hypothetical protein
MIIEHIFFHKIIILPSITKQYGPIAKEGTILFLELRPFV